MEILLETAWALIVGVGGLALLIWALASTVARQKRAASQVDESLGLCAAASTFASANDLTEQVVKNQEEMIRLLRQLVGHWHRSAEAAGAFRPSEPTPPLPRTGGGGIGGGE